MLGRWFGNSLIPQARTEPPTGSKVIECYHPRVRGRTQAPGRIQPSKHTCTKECRSKFENPPPVLEFDGFRPAKTVERPADVPVEEDTRDIAVENLVAKASDQGAQ